MTADERQDHSFGRVVHQRAGAPNDGRSTESHDQHRAERERRLKLSLGTALLTKPLAVVIPVVSVPLFLRYLGNERYGLYEAVAPLGVYLSMTNLGLGLGLMNKLIDCNVSGDRELARRYVSTMSLALGAIVVAAAVLWSVVAAVVDWRAIFQAEDPLAILETQRLVWVTGMVAVLGVAARLPTPIYSGYQELHRDNLWDGAAKILTLVACFAVVFSPWGIVGVVLVITGVPALVRLGNTLDMFVREKTWLGPRFRLFDKRLLGVLVGSGIGFFILQLSVPVIFQTGALIIGIVIEPAAVTEYAVVGKAYLIVYGLFNLLLVSLWPAYGEALRRGDIAWVKKMLRLSLLLGCGIILLCGIVMFFFGNQVVSLWTRGEMTVAARSLVLPFTAMFVLRAWVDCRSIALNSVGVIGPQIWFFTGHAVLNVITAIIMAKWFGVVGVAWATPITALVTSAWGYPWLIRRYVTRRDH